MSGQAAAEVEMLPAESLLTGILSDDAMMRDQARDCDQNYAWYGPPVVITRSPN